MGLEIINQKINVGKKQDFLFSDNVGYNYVLGISEFYLTYGDNTDHDISDMEIQLSAQVSGNKITVTPTISMNDGHGNKIDDASFVNVIVFAAIGDSSQNYYTTGNYMNIGDSDSSNSIMYNSNTVIRTNAFLSGFQFKQDTPHYVEDFHTGCGVSSDSSNQGFRIASTAVLANKSGDKAQGSLDAGYLVCYTNDDIQVGHLTVNKSSEEQYSFSNPIENVYIVLTDINMSFGSTDHQIRTISATTNISNGITLEEDQKTVMIRGNLYMDDNDGHSTSTASASYLLIGI